MDTSEIRIPNKDTSEIRIPNKDTSEIRIPNKDTSEIRIPNKDTSVMRTHFCGPVVSTICLGGARISYSLSTV